MPRATRIHTEEGVFHILTRGNNRQIVFHDGEDFQVYKEKLRELKEDQPFKLYHYCLMSNHVHLIMETNEDTNLSRLMKRLNLSYYRHYKKKYAYAGHFWQDRFKSLLVDKDHYLLACGLYVERNPVKAKMVTKPEDYKHSSYQYYAYGKQDRLIDRNINYEGLGKNDKDRQPEYRRLMMNDENKLDSNIFAKLYLGSAEFVKKMEERFGVKNARTQKGRPRKDEK